MNSRFLIIFFCAFASSQIFAMDVPQTVDVKAGDTAGLINAINEANAGTGANIIFIVKGDNDETEFVFSEPAAGFDSALPDITSKISFFGSSGVNPAFRTTIDATGMFRLFKVTGDMGEADLSLSGFTIDGFGTSQGDGGAIEVSGDSKLVASGTTFENNSTSGSGGAIAVGDDAKAEVTSCNFKNNLADDNAGAIKSGGNANLDIQDSEFYDNSSKANGGAISAEGLSSINMVRLNFQNNVADVFGCDVNVASGVTNNTFALDVQDSQFASRCNRPLVENPFGAMRLRNSTFYTDSDIIDSTDRVDMQGNIFHIGLSGGEWQSDDGPQPPHKQALCNDFGSNAFNSLGYNIASDDSCALDQETDITGVDPMIAVDEDGLFQPESGSPVIDAGPSEAMKLDGDALVSLPCGYRDIAGTARPQDGNGDGGFECDLGAVEVQGTGDIVTGHSGAFYNASRDGEGTFVEILNDTLAVVFTFTYRPDGSGPAWFVGLGDINKNSIVIDNLTRPVGTSFGAGFNKDDVVRTPVGGMSMVFPDCAALAPGGNVAYSGDVDLGYEGLITRATRLSKVTGCTGGEANANVGLSGSYYDPERDGEGIITEWFTNGDVLVVFFTYDQNDNQMWVLGVGTPNGKSVTINARYPTAYSRWGSGYDADDTTQSDWGTFTLTWTDCNSVDFGYNSTVAGFGSASYSYKRLTRLQDTSCPDF